MTKYQDEKGRPGDEGHQGPMSRQELFKGLVHEFTNMLTAVIGYSELALDVIEHSHPARNWLEKIRSHTKELALMTQKLTAMNHKSEMNDPQ